MSTFYTLDIGTFNAALHTFYDGVKQHMPNTVHIQVEPSGDSIEDTTGELVGTWSADPVAEIIGGGAQAYSAPSGLVVTWLTSSVLNGSRLRGRTFMVPLAGDSYEPDGTLSSGMMGAFSTAAGFFIQAESDSFVIWHRPKFGPKPAGGGERPITRTGGHGLVVASRITDKAAILRSRRD